MAGEYHNRPEGIKLLTGMIVGAYDPCISCLFYVARLSRFSKYHSSH